MTEFLVAFRATSESGIREHRSTWVEAENEDEAAAKLIANEPKAGTPCVYGVSRRCDWHTPVPATARTAAYLKRCHLATRHPSGRCAKHRTTTEAR
jgi:hypothetical protein